MLLNLHNLFKEIAKTQGQLSILDLTASYAGPSINENKTTTSHGPEDLNDEDKFLWDTLINHQGKYDKTWKFSLPETATNVSIDKITPAFDNQLIVFGRYKINTVNEASWLKLFDCQGNCIMQWEIDCSNGEIVSAFPLTTGNILIVKRSDYYIINMQGKLLNHVDLTNYLKKDYIKTNTLSADNIFAYDNDTLIFFNQGGELLKKIQMEKDKSVVNVFPLSEKSLAVVVNCNQRKDMPSVIFYDKDCNSINTHTYAHDSVLGLEKGSNNLVIVQKGEDILEDKERINDEFLRYTRKKTTILAQFLTNKGVLYRHDLHEYQSTKTIKRKIVNFDGFRSYHPTDLIYKTVGEEAYICNVSSDSIQIQVTKHEYHTEQPVYNYFDIVGNMALTSTKQNTVSKKLEHTNGYTYDWSDNQIKEVNSKLFGKPLPQSRSQPQEVYLEFLWQALIDNQTIKRCLFPGLPLTDTDAIGIAQVIRNNRSIQFIDITGTEITDIGARYLLAALQVHPSIEIIVKGNHINAALIKHFDWHNERAKRKITQEEPTGSITTHIPDEFFDLKTQLIYADPVFDAQGDTHEREVIEKINGKSLIPNKALKKQIDALLTQNPALKISSKIYFPKSLQHNAFAAVDNNDKNSLDQLIEQDIRLLSIPLEKLDGNSQLLFSYIIEKGTLEIFEYIIEKMAKDITSFYQTNGDTLLFEAAAHKFGTKGALLLGQALGWNKADYLSYLFKAVKNANLYFIKIYAPIAPLDGLDANGNTALHTAVLDNHQAIIKLLIECGADIHALNIDGIDCVNLAQKINRSELAKYIIQEQRHQEIKPFLQPFLDKIEYLESLLKSAIPTIAPIAFVDELENAKSAQIDANALLAHSAKVIATKETDMTQLIESRKNELEDAQKHIQELTKIISAKQAQLDKNTEKLLSLENTIKDLQENAQTSNEQLTQLINQTAVLREEKNQLILERQHMEGQLQSLNARLRVIETEQTNFKIDSGRDLSQLQMKLQKAQEELTLKQNEWMRRSTQAKELEVALNKAKAGVTEQAELLKKQLAIFEKYGLSPQERAFHLFLSDVKRLLQRTNKTNITCYISYAWEDNQAANEALQTFLLRIERDLKELGVKIYLDINNLTGHIKSWMINNIAQSDYILLIGTEKFKSRVANPNTNVGLEWQECLKKLKQNPNSLIPLLYQGEFNTAFPDEITHNLIRDARPSVKYNDLMAQVMKPISLIRSIFEIYHDGLNQNLQEDYQVLWDKFSAQVDKINSEFAGIHVSRPLINSFSLTGNARINNHPPALNQSTNLTF